MFYSTEKDDHGLARPPFKSCAVPRVIGWISTMSKDGVPNLAPYSQFTNLGFNPPFVVLACNTNEQNERKDTTVNIEETGEFVYNMVTYDLREQMNASAAPYPPEVDEFEKAGLTKAPSEFVKPFRVAESPIQMECKLYTMMRLPSDAPMGPIDLIIGKVVGVHIKDEYIMEDGKIDILKIRPLARMGYSDYTSVTDIFPIEISDAAGHHSSNGMEGGFGSGVKQ